MKSISLKEAIQSGLVNELETNLTFIDSNVPDLQVLVFEEDVVRSALLDLYDIYAEQHIAGWIVNGNLIVNNAIVDYESDTYSAFLLVNGNLVCDNLVAGCTEIVVKGDVHVRQTFIGYYNHGRVLVNGNLHAGLWIEDDHQTTVKGEVEAVTFCKSWHIPSPDYSVWRDILMPSAAEELLEGDHLFAGDKKLIEKVKNGWPIFRDDLARTGITVEDLSKYLNTPLLGPELEKIVIRHNEWTISISRGSGETPHKILLINTAERHSFYMSVNTDGGVILLYETPDEEWEEIVSKDSPEWKLLLRYVTKTLAVLREKEQWNEQYRKEVSQEQLWHLIWQLNPSGDQAAFHPIASDILNRVVYAASFPFAYVHARYKADSMKRGLEEHPGRLPAVALLDGLLHHGLIAELSGSASLSGGIDQLNSIATKYWNTSFNIPEAYVDAPVDEAYLIWINGQLASYGVGIASLEVGINNYLLACVQLDALNVLKTSMNELGVKMLLLSGN